MITRKEVAKAARVSETVVSYVVNNSNYVSEEKRALVLDAIQKLGYEPNYFAKSLKTKKSRDIRLFIPTLIQNSLLENYAELEQAASNKNYIISISQIQHSISKLPYINQSRSDGVIMFLDHIDEDEISRIADKGLAVLLLGTQNWKSFDPRVSYIHLDIAKSMNLLFRKFRDCGRRSVGYLVDESDISTVKSSGKYQAALDASLSNQLDIELLPICMNDASRLNESIDKLISGNLVFDAIFAENDLLAMMFISRARSRNISIPDEIAVAGFGDSILSACFSPSLTSIRYDKSKLARSVILEMINHIETEQPRLSVIETEVVFRQST